MAMLVIFTIILLSIQLLCEGDPINEIRNADVEENKFLTAVSNKCTVSRSDFTDDGLKILDICKNFNINDTIINNTNNQNVRCYLYYNRFVNYCQTKPPKFKFPTLAEVTNQNYTLEQICSHIYARNIYPNMTTLICDGLCIDFNVIRPECLWAYYYDEISNKSNHSNTDNSTGSNSASVHNTPISNRNGQNPNSEATSNNNGHILKTNAQQTLDISTTSKKSSVPATSQDQAGSTALPTQTEDLDKKKAQKDTETAQPHPTENLENETREEDLNSKTLKDVQETNNLKTDNPKRGDNKVVPIDVEETNEEKTSHVAEQIPVATGDSKKPANQPTLDENTLQQTPENIKKEDLTQKQIDNQEPNTPDDEDEGNHDDTEAEDFNNLNNEANKNDVHFPEPKGVKNKPAVVEETPMNKENLEEIDSESYFMSYFMAVCVLVVLGYVGYHNRIKVMALILEGKKSKRHYRSRRPNSANYHKLDSNLEEAISSNVTKNTSNVIY